MKKHASPLLVQATLVSVLALSLSVFPAAFAEEASSTNSATLYPATITQTPPRVIGAPADSAVVGQVMKLYQELSNASNQHSITDLMKHFSPQFISGDNFTLEQLKQQILDTWKAYPDIKYSSQVVEIRFQGDWVTLETLDLAEATAPAQKEFMDQTPGKMTSQSRNLLFLKHSGQTLEIKSDHTIWEQAVIRYGVGEDVNITLSVPEQVKAGDNYSATVYANIPDNTFLIGTIANQPITFPHLKPDDAFRTLDSDGYELQRVLTANSQNRNEIVSATLGMTNIGQKLKQERPSLSVNGLITIVKRVNVVPTTNEDMMNALKKQTQVQSTASGKEPLKSPSDVNDDTQEP